jgi:hypothetical protein
MQVLGSRVYKGPGMQGLGRKVVETNAPVVVRPHAALLEEVGGDCEEGNMLGVGVVRHRVGDHVVCVVRALPPRS